MAALKKFIYYTEDGRVLVVDGGDVSAAWLKDKSPVLYSHGMYFTDDVTTGPPPVTTYPCVYVTDDMILMADALGNWKFAVSRVANKITIDFSLADVFILPVKTDTGDPASPSEGQEYVNTFDRVKRLYANGAWHTVASW